MGWASLFSRGRRITLILIGHFRVPKPLTLKTRPSANLSCANEFYLHDNKKSFSRERFCTWSRLKTEACGISKMAC